MFDWFNQVNIQRASQLLHTGGVIAYPTEAVWGLGVDPFNAVAVGRLLSLKQRSIDKGLIVVAANIKQLEPYLLVSSQQRQQLEASWPGPITWLVPNNNMFPHWIYGKYTKVALRVSNHPVVRGLCLAFGGPIVSTSANPQGKCAPRFSWQVRRYFKQHVDFYTPGSVGGRERASEIRDLLSGQVIRRG
jgi:L-threonylcarbamoyladenylate synthase